MRSILKPLTACLFLGACGSVVMSTAVVLGMSASLQDDPAGYEVAVTIPEGVDVQTGGATLGVSNANTIHSVDEQYTYVLARREAPDGQTLFRVNPTDLDGLRDLRARVTAWEAEDSRGAIGPHWGPSSLRARRNNHKQMIAAKNGEAMRQPAENPLALLFTNFLLQKYTYGQGMQKQAKQCSDMHVTTTLRLQSL